MARGSRRRPDRHAVRGHVGPRSGLVWVGSLVLILLAALPIIGAGAVNGAAGLPSLPPLPVPLPSVALPTLPLPSLVPSVVPSLPLPSVVPSLPVSSLLPSLPVPSLVPSLPVSSLLPSPPVATPTPAPTGSTAPTATSSAGAAAWLPLIRKWLNRRLMPGPGQRLP